jgi:transcriptional regulator with XRE-family HTH domain
MASTLGRAIRRARLAVGFTQVQLGRRVGLKGRAVYRWERGDSEPRKRHRRELIVVLNAVNPVAASALAAAFDQAARERAPSAAVPPAPLPAPPRPPEPKVTLDLAILALADELDVSPRRLRLSLSKLLQRLREQELTLAQAEQHLATWIASHPI